MGTIAMDELQREPGAALAALQSVWPWINDHLPGWADRLKARHPVLLTLKKQSEWTDE